MISKGRKVNLFNWHEPPDDRLPEQSLWVAIITQAMMDALSRAGSAEAAYHRGEAIHWLTTPSKDFNEVCLNAGFEPDYIRRMAKKTLEKKRLWRAPAGKGKRYQERKLYRKRMKKWFGK